MSAMVSEDDASQGLSPYSDLSSTSGGTTAQSDTPATSTSRTSSSNSTEPNNDKGKGKALDNEGGTESLDIHSVAKEEEEEGEGKADPALARSRDDLRLLASVDPAMAERLVELDPTPTSQLPTTTKLMKAISLLTSGCSVMNDLGSSTGLPLTTYCQLVELLSSTLSDVNESLPQLRSKPRTVSLHHLEVARAKLSLPLQNAVPPSTSSLAAHGVIAIGPCGVVIGEAPTPPSEVSLLFAENARLALTALRPSSLFPTPSDHTASSSGPAAGIGLASSPPGSSPISKLPSELLLYIIRFANAAAAETVTETSASTSVASGRVTEIWNGRVRRQARDEFGNPINAFSGSEGAAQRFTLALARVSKAWVEPARSVALRHLHLHQAAQIEDLLSVLSVSPSLKRAVPSVQAISATLVPPGSNDASAGGVSNASLNRLVGRLTVRRGRPPTSPVTFSRSKSDKDGSSGSTTPAENWSQIVQSCPNIKGIKLEILPNPARWAGFSRNPSTTEFLDAAVLGTLSATRTIRYLDLGFSIDFEELEVVMLGLPNLERVSIRAIDCISGVPTVTSTINHPADKIHTFKIGDSTSSGPYGIQEYTAISDAQLAWLLEPAVASGSLRELELSILIDPGVGGGWPPGLPGGPANFGANANAPPFASSTLADLLVRCGSNLSRLVLQDLGESGAVNPNLAAAPHNSNFDHALSTLTSLRELSLQFAYTGSAFLASLSSIPHLRTLSLAGTPIHTSADSFADKLEHGLGELETLSISGQFAGARGAQGGWNGAGVRRVKQAAKERGLQGAFGG